MLKTAYVAYGPSVAQADDLAAYAVVPDEPYVARLFYIEGKRRVPSQWMAVNFEANDAALDVDNRIAALGFDDALARRAYRENALMAWMIDHALGLAKPDILLVMARPQDVAICATAGTQSIDHGAPYREVRGGEATELSSYMFDCRQPETRAVIRASAKAYLSGAVAAAEFSHLGYVLSANFAFALGDKIIERRAS